MEKIDIKILGCLKKNARLTASAISEEINLSVSAVIERIKKLENSGLIKGYTIELDQEKLGNDVVALMEV
ncbi:MAG: winged helix-turn-helix transcriptional regulator, partial [Lachnospiraceae bacterium]|nr:winged helix-turn-helix transcriptional regulator [Lachnospiraceae bacterium]